MPIRLTVFLLILCILFFAIIFYTIKKGTILIQYALLWIVFDFLMILSLLFPSILESIAHFLGIQTVSNMIFLFGFGILLIINLVLTSILSHQKIKITILAQELSIEKDMIRNDKKLNK